MSKRLSVLIAAAAAVFGCLTSTATATAAQPPSQPSQPDCDTILFPLSFGEDIQVSCDDATGTYQVIAQCTDGANIWTVPGTLAAPGMGPSVAECEGTLLFPAHVLSHFVIQ